MANSKKILVVDDEEDMVTWLTTLLEDNGYSTIAAYNGAEGFEKAKTEKPDLITLDISMDKESGVKTLRHLQEDELTSGIPVIIVTGVATEIKQFIERQKHVRPPAGFMEKPIEKDELLKTVAKLVQ
jgi:CheY-like chemotaxis protein